MENERPLIGLLYMHFKGDVYVIRGFAFEETTKKESVIYSNVTTGSVYHRPLENFFEIHPVKLVKRFILVHPRKITDGS